MPFLRPRRSWYATEDRLVWSDHPPGMPAPRFVLERPQFAALLVVSLIGAAGLAFVFVNLAVDPQWRPSVRGRLESPVPGLVAGMVILVAPFCLIPWVARSNRRAVRHSAPTWLSRDHVVVALGIGKTEPVPWDDITAIVNDRRVLELTLTGGRSARFYHSGMPGAATAVRRFWENPDERRLIGTPASVDIVTGSH